MQDDNYGGKLAGYAYPVPVEIPGVRGAFRRKWVLRVRELLPSSAVLRDHAFVFQQRAREEIAAACGECVAEDWILPAVAAVRLDDYHLVLEIDCHRPETAKGDEATIVTAMTLQAADQMWHVEDLEGVPRRFWFVLGSRIEQS